MGEKHATCNVSTLALAAQWIRQIFSMLGDTYAEKYLGAVTYYGIFVVTNGLLFFQQIEFD